MDEAWMGETTGGPACVDIGGNSVLLFASRCRCFSLFIEKSVGYVYYATKIGGDMDIIAPSDIFRREGDCIVFLQAIDSSQVSKVGDHVEALKLTAPEPFRQANSSGDLAPVSSLEDFCEEAQRMAIKHKKLFSIAG